MSSTDQLSLGDYLRSRRALMTPPTTANGRRGAQRRVPGLRRQELSQTAGISVEYYTRLEQGRASRPSRDVLAALARAFGLADVERDHLFRLAGEMPPDPPSPHDRVRPGLLRLLRSLDAVMPATIHDGRLNLLASNASADVVLGMGADSGGRFDRNIVHFTFRGEPLPEMLSPDGADGVNGMPRFAASELRRALSRYPGDEYLRDLFDELHRTSEQFRELWERGEITPWHSVVKQVQHPDLGWLTFDTEVLHDNERDHSVVLYNPRPGTELPRG